MLQSLGQRRCSLSTFGFGAEHNAELLQGLAVSGEGTYSYVESEEQISHSFGEALGGLLTTTHQNVKLSLKLEPGVHLHKTLTAYPYELEDGGVTINIGDLFAEERRDVLVTLALSAAEEGSQNLGVLGARGFSLLDQCPEKVEGMLLSVERKAP